MPFDVRMPDGTLVRNIPEGTTKEQVLAKYQASQPEQEQFSGWESLGRGALEGITLGGIDEIYGGARALFTDDTYEEARDRFREEQKAAREEDPWTFGAAELVSGFAIPGLGATKAAGGAAKMLPRVARAAGVGAGYGAAAGAGYSEGESVGEVAGDVARGTVLGGAVGGALPAAARAAQRMRYRYTPEQRIAREVRDSLQLEGLTTEDAAAMLKQNPNMVLADLSEATRQRLTSLAREDPGAFDALTARDRRIGSQAVDEAFGDFDVRFPKPSSEMYEEAFKAAPDNMPQQLNRLLGYWDDKLEDVVPGRFTERLEAVNPDIIKRARSALVARGIKPVANPRSKSGLAKNKKYANEYLQGILAELRDVGTGKSAMAGAARKLRRDLMTEVEKVSPAHAQASRQYGMQKAAREAAEPAYNRTAKALRKNPDKFLRELESADINSQVVKDLETVLPAGETREMFLEAQQALRMMARTRADLIKERNTNPTIIREADVRLTKIREDVKNLIQAFGASKLGVGDHGLMIGAAVRRLYGSVTESIPFFGGFASRGGRDNLLIKTLTGRTVPKTSVATQRPLSRSVAAAAGGLGAMQGRE